MWPFKKNETQLNSKVELALPIGHLDAARQYFIIVALESIVPARGDQEKFMSAANSLYAKTNPFMAGGSWKCLGSMMSDDFTHHAFEEVHQSVCAGVVNGLFTMKELLGVLQQKREKLEKKAQGNPKLTPDQLNPPLDNGFFNRPGKS